VSVKNLQATHGLQLHRSLLWPDCYIKLLDGECPELDRFINTCKTAKLIDVSADKYIFNEKLLNEYGFDEVRIENPVMVYENEVEPLTEVHQTVDAALDGTETMPEKDIASYMFDDELRSYQWNLEHFNTPEFDGINKKETATEDAEPYLLLPKTKCKTGVLLLHGLLATPAELRKFGDDLCKQGYAVMGVRIAGHGTSPHDLAGLSWNDWLASVARGHKILSAFCERIVIIGFSTGATLALAFAAGNPENLVGVAAVSPAIKLRDKKSALIPFVQGINKMTKWMPNTEGLLEFIDNDPENPEINYRSTPVSAIGGLLELSEHTQKGLGQISSPVRIIQGDSDPVVDPDGAKMVFDGLSVVDKSLHWIASDKHGILIDDVGDTHELLASFIRRMEGN
ncbi:MAG: alpha/beta fold hydrolase, partial [Rhodospirillaceae bacterium]|nr:alpha/beta fold hydrolase [Rhodospirillaceae bacterium]